MEIVLATDGFDGVGGSETYLLTVGEEHQRLGHGVTIHLTSAARCPPFATRRGLTVSVGEERLPERCDAIVVQDSAMAHALAERWPTTPAGVIPGGRRMTLCIRSDVDAGVGEQSPTIPAMAKHMTSEADELQALRERTRELEMDLEALRQAHEAQARHLVAERLALANEIEQEVTLLREEVDWRREVMEVQERQLKMLRNSRSLRYTEPLRRIASALRRT